MASIRKTVSILCVDSLFSTITTLHVLILLYFPSLFRQLVFYPLIILTIVLLFSILRLHKTRFSAHEEKERDSNEINSCPALSDDTTAEHELSPTCELSDNSFLEWDVRAPLDVIYEEHEGQAEENSVFEEIRTYKMNEIQRYASLSLFYPESDSNDSLDGNSPRTCDWTSRENEFSWSEEEDCDDVEGLIEIALDERKMCSDIEEDNLIEIDL